MYNSICPNCNESFDHPRPVQVYCDHECRAVMAEKREEERKKESKLKHIEEAKLDPKRIYCDKEGKVYIKAFKKEPCTACICGYKTELDLNQLGLEYSEEFLKREYERLDQLNTIDIERKDINKVNIALKWIESIKAKV